MSEPLTATQFAAALRAEGLTVIEYDGWRTHNRNHKGPWGPVHGSLQHHTVSSGTASSVALCRNGYAELPGPLCHGVIDKTGTVHLIGYGRTNHAGGGDPNVLQAVIDERYGERPPVPRVGNANGIDGNRHFYGFECINLGDGKDPWPAEQVEAMVRSSAALDRAHGWTEKSSIAHREWSSDKPDPAGPGMPSMPAFRARIKERLAHAASWNPPADPGPGPQPTTPPNPGDTVPNLTTLLRAADITLLEGVPQTIFWDTEYADDPNGHGVGGSTVLANAKYTGTMNVKLAGLGAGEYAQVWAVEVDANGVILGEGAPSDIQGSADDVQVNVAFTGRVWQRLAFRVLSQGDGPVTVEDATLVLLSWPNS